MDAVSKYATTPASRSREGVYDLDKQALDLKRQAVEEARKAPEARFDAKPPSSGKNEAQSASFPRGSAPRCPRLHSISTASRRELKASARRGRA